MRRILLISFVVLFACNEQKEENSKSRSVNTEGKENKTVIPLSELEEAYITIQRFKDSVESCCLNLTDEKSSVNELSSQSSERSNNFDNGVYHALIIGVQDYEYKHLTDLDHPINDARNLRNILVQNYTFDPKNVKVLENPKKTELEAELDNISERVEADDNVLIFFAGHGNYHKGYEEGYWYPADATKSHSTWISNGYIKKSIQYLSKKVRNILLISDACFSGGILKMRGNTLLPQNSEDKYKSNKELYFKSSCKAMTSGAMSPVDDKSVFFQSIIHSLKNHNEPWLSSRKLHSGIQEYVISESKNTQTPQFGTLLQASDEGGDFIFIKK